jgi:2'-5' RNA ligase
MKKRLFLAVNYSVTVTRRIADATAKLRAACDGAGIKVTWAPPQSLHITTKFLGWANGEVVDAVRDQMAAVLEGRKSFEIGARGVGAYPDERRPHVLWVGVHDGSGTLAAIAEATDAAMGDIGFPREKRAFSPHVTIGRVKDPAGGVHDICAPFRGADFGASPVREVILYESVMKSTGSEYLALFRLPLAGPAARAERQTRDVEEGSTNEESNGGPTGESDRARRQLD